MKWRIILLLSLFLLMCSRRVYATTLTISEFTVPSFINDEVKSLQVTVSTSSTASAYLRPVFFASSTSSYFGCGKNDVMTDFFCGTTMSSYPQIVGSGTFTISVKPDISSATYQQNANQDVSFKVRRCTNAATSSCTDDSNTVLVHLTTTTPVPATATPAPTATPTPSPVPQPTKISLNEFMACPSSGGEWIELYNGNDTTVTLTDWKMRDSTETNVSNLNGEIGPKGYEVFNVSDLNNDTDTVRLYDGAGFAVESMHYDKCSSSLSWSKKSDGTWGLTTVTKGGANIFPTPTPTPSATPKASATPVPTLSPDAEGAEVLGASTDTNNDIPTLVVHATPQPEASNSGKAKGDSPLFAVMAIFLGLISLLGLGGYLWYDWKKHK